jgi:uncharacterized protein YqeY
MTTSALYLKLQAENLAARKAKNEDATSALGGLIDATQKLAKSQKEADQREITDEYVQLAARLEAKMTSEQVDANTAAGRSEQAGSFQRKLDILKPYLPDELGVEELKAVIREIAAGNEAIAKNPKAGMGIVIKELKERFGTRFDSKSMSPVVKDVLGA